MTREELADLLARIKEVKEAPVTRIVRVVIDEHGRETGEVIVREVPWRR